MGMRYNKAEGGILSRWDATKGKLVNMKVEFIDDILPNQSPSHVKNEWLEEFHRLIVEVLQEQKDGWEISFNDFDLKGHLRWEFRNKETGATYETDSPGMASEYNQESGGGPAGVKAILRRRLGRV